MRLPTLLLMLLISAPAGAEWVKLGETDEDTFYVDPATVQIGHFDFIRRASTIQIPKRSDPQSGAKSSRSWDEYDCMEKKLRNLVGSWFSEPMAAEVKAFTIPKNVPSAWMYIPPGPAPAAALEFVCADR